MLLTSYWFVSRWHEGEQGVKKGPDVYEIETRVEIERSSLEEKPGKPACFCLRKTKSPPAES